MEAARLHLWEISDAHEALAEKLEQAGGEITPELEAEWDTLTGSFEAKAEGCALYVRELSANAAAAKEEADRLEALYKSLAAKAQRMKAYLQHNMERVGRKDLKTPKVHVWVQANGGRPGIRWTLPAESLPVQFRRVTVEVDSQAVQDAYEANALPDGFVVSERGRSLRIK